MEFDSKDNARWYALHVKSRHEFQAFERLTGAGIETFLPSWKKNSQWKDRNKIIQLPLFPGYLFVRTDNNHATRLAILKTKGVVRILGTIPGEPEPVPDEQVLSLKKIIDTGINIDPFPYLREGQRVRIIRGPLAGIEGILAQKPNHRCLVLSVDIISQSTAVTIEAGDVEAV